WSRERRFIGLDGTLFHTHFRDRILPDFDSDPRLIIYAGLDGHAVSRGAALNVETRLGDALRLNAGTTWMEVYTVEEGRRTEVLFAPRWSGTFNASYEVRARLTIDLTGQVYGPMRLPVQP